MRIDKRDVFVSKDTSKLKIGIVFGKFNASIGNKLLAGTVAALLEMGIRENNLKIFSVPGSLEIPLTVQKIARKFDAIIALGIVLKGETYHFEIVSNESHRALMDIGLKYNVPVVFGIICAYTESQARERADEKKMDKGREFAATAVEMATMIKKM